MRQVLNNPAVRRAGKVGVIVAGAALVGKGVYEAGKWVAKKTAPFRADLVAHYNKVKAEARAKRDGDGASETAKKPITKEFVTE
jgi:hypothetical protein